MVLKRRFLGKFHDQGDAKRIVIRRQASTNPYVHQTLSG
jgi:hypothetical protein